MPNEPPPPYNPSDYHSTSLQDTSLHSLSLQEMNCAYSTSLPDGNHPPPRYSDEDLASYSSSSSPHLSTVELHNPRKSYARSVHNEDEACAQDIVAHDLKNGVVHKSDRNRRSGRNRTSPPYVDVNPSSRAAELSEIHNYIKQVRRDPSYKRAHSVTGGTSLDATCCVDDSGTFHTANESGLTQTANVLPNATYNIDTGQTNHTDHSFTTATHAPIHAPERENTMTTECTGPVTTHLLDHATQSGNPYQTASHLLSNVRDLSEDLNSNSVNSNNNGNKIDINSPGRNNSNELMDCHDEAFLYIDEEPADNNNTETPRRIEEQTHDRRNTNQHTQAHTIMLSDTATGGLVLGVKGKSEGVRRKTPSPSIAQSKHTFV